MWPNESSDYRTKRNQLLEAEAGLRRQVEEIAKLRRELPLGGKLEQGYEFTDATTGDAVSMDDLFEAGKDTLILYNLMFKETDASPCVMCASMLDSLNGAAQHISDQVNLAVVARAPAQKIHTLAEHQGWQNLRFLSSADNSYNPDYGGEDAAGNQWPMLHVWQKTQDGIHHFWGSELFGYKGDPEWQGHARHVDQIWPLWNLLDLTPAGRGESWFPKLAY